MCGIAGVFGSGPERTVRDMLSTLVHRGPDDEHLQVGPDFAIGARRLSIVDIAGGRQPMSNEDATVWAAQNGEIYNFRELRKDLVARGHALHTHCDTESLPHLYEEHGAAFVDQLDGMFAVAIWDARRKVGHIARDRMGEKPLYWTQHGGAVYFASEIKALLRVPGFARRVNLEALHHYLSYKHVPAPLTIFQGIHALPPAHILTFAPGGVPVVRRYWDVSFGGDALRDASEEELAERTLALLDRSIERRLMGDVPIGFFLSGGIDSSLTVALAAARSTRRLRTFTLTYGEGSTADGKESDRHWARWAAERFDTDHHEEEITFSDLPTHLRRIMTCFDEPFAAAVSPYFLGGAIVKHVTVALSGDGADELFGSYLSHRLAFPLANLDDYRRTGDRGLIRPFEDRPEYLEELGSGAEWEWRRKLFVYSEQQKAEIYGPDVADAMSCMDTGEQLRTHFPPPGADGDPLNRILAMEFRTMFPDQLLTLADRLSMVHSLEVRTPYLDPEFVQFAAQIPGRLKITAGGETKYLLKKAARRHLPDDMVSRPKEGFILPITQWLMRDLGDFVRDTLRPERLARHGLFDQAAVARLIDGMYASTPDYRYVNRVYSLLCFQIWHDIYME